jgi:hypothetical protein
MILLCTFAPYFFDMIKNLFFVLFLVLAITACESSVKMPLRGPQTVKGKVYGDSILDNGIRDINTLEAMMQKNASMKIKVKGVVNDVCVNKGCWVTMKLSNGETMRITFKDYGFFVPKDIKGKEIVVDGDAKVEELSVEDQRHFAEDGGASKAEIDKITAVKKVLAFEAKGVVIP